MERRKSMGVKLDEQTYTAVVALVELSPHPTTIVGVIRQAVFALKAERERQALATASMESTLKRKQMLASRPMRASEARKRNTPIQMSVDRNDPWDAPVGQKAAGFVRRCECGQWRLVTVESCPGCGSRDGYETRDVGKDWLDAMRSGLTSEEQIIEVVSGGGQESEARQEEELARLNAAPPTSNPADEWHGDAYAMVRCNPCKSWRCTFEEGCPVCGDVVRTSTGHMVSRAWFDRYLAQDTVGKPLIA